MRRTLVLIVVATLAAGAAEAASGTLPVSQRTPGAELLELRAGNGRAVVSRRGSLLVRVGSGRIRVVDLPGGARPFRRCNKRGVVVSSSTVEYRGRDVRCRVWSGQEGRPWQMVVRGRRIYASGVVRGSLTLDAFDEGPTGTYRLGDGVFQHWPRAARTYVLRR